MSDYHGAYKLARCGRLSQDTHMATKKTRKDLTKEDVDQICAYMDVPMTLEDACKVVGYGPRAIKNWIELGEDPDCDDELLRYLATNVAYWQTHGKRGELMSLAMAQAVAEPKMAMFMIERLMPNMTLTKNIKVDATVAPKAPSIDYSKATDEQIAALKAAEEIKLLLGSGD